MRVRESFHEYAEDVALTAKVICLKTSMVYGMFLNPYHYLLQMLFHKKPLESSFQLPLKDQMYFEVHTILATFPLNS